MHRKLRDKKFVTEEDPKQGAPFLVTGKFPWEHSHHLRGLVPRHAPEARCMKDMLLFSTDTPPRALRSLRRVPSASVTQTLVGLSRSRELVAEVVDARKPDISDLI